MVLLFAAIIHLLSFISVLLYVPITVYPGIVFWRYFFSFYTGLACFVVALALNQLRNFLNSFEETEAKRHDLEGYETVQHSAEYYDTGESGETYDIELQSEKEYFNHLWRDWDI